MSCRVQETGQGCGRRFPLRDAELGEKRRERKRICERRSRNDEENHKEMRTNEWIWDKASGLLWSVLIDALHRSRRLAINTRGPSETWSNCKVCGRRRREEGNVKAVGVSVVGRREAVTATLSAMSAMSKGVRKVWCEW